MANSANPLLWRGNDRAFDIMVSATQRCQNFNMGLWGHHDLDNNCGTSACLWGNYAAADRAHLKELTGRSIHYLGPGDIFPDEAAAARYLGVSFPEFAWLLAEHDYPLTELASAHRWYDLDEYGGNRKSPRKEPNLNRLLKFLAYKRRKRDLLELDAAMQAADRQLLRQEQRAKRLAAALV